MQKVKADSLGLITPATQLWYQTNLGWLLYLFTQSNLIVMCHSRLRYSGPCKAHSRRGVIWNVLSMYHTEHGLFCSWFFKGSQIHGICITPVENI